MTERLISLLGLFVMIGLAWLLSEDRRRVSWRLVAIALGLQFAFALIVLRTGVGRAFFEGVKAAFMIITEATGAGASFLFGPLANDVVLNSGTVQGVEGTFILTASIAFKVLPIIIVVASLAGILYHLHVIQGAVRAMAWLMRRTLKTSGAETFGAALLVFLGIEAMPTLKGYLNAMTRSEICTVMTVFMATIAADVMVIYATFGAAPGHLLAASIMSAPAAILIAKLMVPETAAPETAGSGRVDVPVHGENVIDGAARGGIEGLQLALNVGALLIAFVSLVWLLNQAFLFAIGYTFTDVMGWFFYPFAWLMGVPAADVPEVARLLGAKIVINEFIAYSDMSGLIAQNALGPRSITIATYALCGFANPGSLGILLAALTALAPQRRADIAQLGLKSLIGGTLAAFTTACVAGVLT